MSQATTDANSLNMLDNFDRQILTLLSENGRLSNLELAQAVGLSHSAVSRRLKRLEDTKVIQGYSARIDPRALGIGVRAFVGVQRRLEVPAAEVVENLKGISAVTTCWIVSGEFDILIQLSARDMDHFSRIMLDEVQTARGVAATKSMFVFSQAKG